MIEPIDLGIPGLTNIERIGAGGNAVVYRARQDDLDRNVVVKVLMNVDAAATRRRFDRERRAMGRLSQASGIAPLYGSGFTPGGQPYLLMPFYERGSLQDWIETTGALPAEQVKHIGVTVARAIHTAHENGVLHRDLKPANILMTRSGHPDVADFGIAHLVDDTLGTSQALTMTPLYTAPEVFDGVDSGPASDIYSVGATLYALLSGRPAYSDPAGGTPVLSLMRRINEDPLPELPETVPRGLCDAITTAMSKNPAERQPTAAALAAELAAVDPTARTRRSRKKPKRSTPRAEAGAAVGVTTKQKTKKRTPVVVAAAVALLVGIGGVSVALTQLGDDDPGTVDGPDPQTTATRPTATEPTADAGPTPTVRPTSAAVDFDTSSARAAADQALVRVEAFSCTGATVTTGVVLNDGIVVTHERVLASPWYIDVTIDGKTRHATPQTSDRNRRLAFVVVEDPSIFDVLPGVVVGEGDRVLIAGLASRAEQAELVASAANASHLEAKLAVDGSIGLVESGDIVVTDSGGLVGIAALQGSTIQVLTPDRIEEGWNRIPPSYGCSSLTRDLGPGDSESSVSPAIGELLTMQQLSNAYANERWDLVRVMEPAKADYIDQRFVSGWRPLRQGFVYPINRQVDDDGMARWRIALIGHETWDGNDLTTLFCLTWTVDPVSGAVAQTDEDNIVVYGSQDGQPQRAGFVDPSDLRSLINQDCPLESTV